MIGLLRGDNSSLSLRGKNRRKTVRKRDLRAILADIAGMQRVRQEEHLQDVVLLKKGRKE